MKLKFSYTHKQTDGEDYEFDLLDKDADIETKLHTIDIESIGCKPFMVLKGEELHLKMKTLESDN